MCYNGFVKSARFFRALRTMRLRHAVLLTPLECADLRTLPSSILSVPVTPLKSALTSHSQLTENTATLSLLECALTSISPLTSLECAVTKNTGGGGQGCNTLHLVMHHSSLATLLKFFRFTLLRTLLHVRKTQLFCFQAIPHSLRKTPGVGDTPSRQGAKEYRES
jgi:hypothetical protein